LRERENAPPRQTHFPGLSIFFSPPM
jgi:hypothetical protein